MRLLALLAAITAMSTVHALPHPDLAVRQVVPILSNDRHVFHHLDRNQRTASRDRELMRQGEAEEPGIDVVPQKARSWRETVTVDRRFMQNPDYSEGGPGGEMNSARPASNTTPTPELQEPTETVAGTA